MSDEQKQCVKCDEWKPLVAFNKQRNTCRTCRNKYGYARRNRPEIKEYDKAYRQLPETKERKRRWNKLPKSKETNRQYIQRPKVKRMRNISHHNRKARKRSLPNTLTHNQWQACLNYWHGCCAICGKQLNDMFGDFKAHADHWIPLSYEGDDNPGTVVTNMIALCKFCNLSKRATMPNKWLEREFGKRKAKQIAERVQTYFDSLE